MCCDEYTASSGCRMYSSSTQKTHADVPFLHHSEGSGGGRVPNCGVKCLPLGGLMSVLNVSVTVLDEHRLDQVLPCSPRFVGAGRETKRDDDGRQMM